MSCFVRGEFTPSSSAGLRVLCSPWRPFQRLHSQTSPHCRGRAVLWQSAKAGTSAVCSPNLEGGDLSYGGIPSPLPNCTEPSLSSLCFSYTFSLLDRVQLSSPLPLTALLCVKISFAVSMHFLLFSYRSPSSPNIPVFSASISLLPLFLPHTFY